MSVPDMPSQPRFAMMDAIGRRELLRRITIAAGCVSAAWLGLVPSLDAQIQVPSEFDAGLDSIAVAFKAPTGMTMGYMSQPKAAGMRPGVVVLHDVSGLSNSVRGMTRSLANTGYAVVAPDLLSPQGGTAGFRGVDAEVQKAVAGATAAAVAQQATAAFAYVKTHGGGGGRGLGLVGFGWGATQALLYATGRTDVAACVAFYPDPKLVLPALAKLTAPTLIVFAADDPATKEGAAGIEQAAAASKRPQTVKREGLPRGATQLPRRGCRREDLQRGCGKRSVDRGASASRPAHEGCGQGKTEGHGRCLSRVGRFARTGTE
jgi:carboxymethylenebutenolidase